MSQQSYTGRHRAPSRPIGTVIVERYGRVAPSVAAVTVVAAAAGSAAVATPAQHRLHSGSPQQASVAPAADAQSVARQAVAERTQDSAVSRAKDRRSVAKVARDQLRRASVSANLTGGDIAKARLAAAAWQAQQSQQQQQMQALQVQEAKAAKTAKRVASSKARKVRLGKGTVASTPDVQAGALEIGAVELKDKGTSTKVKKQSKSKPSTLAGASSLTRNTPEPKGGPAPTDPGQTDPGPTNPRPSDSTGNWVRPTSGRFTSSFGYRIHPVLHIRKLHEGIDIAAPTGTPCYAVADGTVTFAGWTPIGGRILMVTLDNGYVVQYHHLSRFSAFVGERVSAGEMVGAVGNAGRSTGPHLHFGVRPPGSSTFIDPVPFLAAHGIFVR